MDEDMDEDSGGDYSDDSNELDYDTLGLIVIVKREDSMDF
ncbi:14833_t:CDS:2 [Entrophospora sp. SA101]|nr:14833_t:CDS:2 [Entrophospora sp. SA101]